MREALPTRAPTYPPEVRRDAGWTLVQLTGGLRPERVFPDGSRVREWLGFWAVVSGNGTAWVYRVSYADAERTLRHWLRFPPAFATDGREGGA